MSEEQLDKLSLLRKPFPANQVGKLAKGSKAQTQCDKTEKLDCAICGGWHHPKMIHLDYVGHAALTDRLLDADPGWFWEPLALHEGLPKFDASGGLWIKLTVCGVTRLGYGNAQESEYKEVGSRDKEVIGDALRNAAMRFGAALELWHKGDLHVEEEKPKETQKETTGQIVNVELALGKIDSPEIRKNLHEESKRIETSFYEVGVKAALLRYHAFRKDAGDDEDEALWALMDSKARSGLKKALAAVPA